MDELKKNNKKTMVSKTLLIIAGTFFAGLGIAGIFIPVLPTTPFILISAALYAKSSRKFYNWLINNRVFGKYLKDYREGKGIPVKVKIITITFLWATITVSAIFALEALWSRILLLLIAAGVTWHIAAIKPKVKDNYTD